MDYFRQVTRFGRNSWNVVMVGTPSSGKSSILYSLYNLKGDNEVRDCFTAGSFWVKTLQYKHLTITSWDIATRELMYSWRKYGYLFAEADAIVYVFDSAEQDAGYMETAMTLWHRLLTSRELQDIPILVLATKQDLAHAIPVHAIVTQLGIPEATSRVWHVKPTSHLRGDAGAKDGMAWLMAVLQKKKREWVVSVARMVALTLVVVVLVTFLVFSVVALTR